METLSFTPSQPSRKPAFLAFLIVFVLVFATCPGFGQTYSVIHSFTGTDGANPYAGVTLDRAGNLYGTASVGGRPNHQGTVYQLTRNRGGWMLATIYDFGGSPSDGATPQARVVFGPGGALYGTTAQGGSGGWGTVFKLLPPVHVCTTPSCPWSETLLYQFGDPHHDAATPSYGDVVFDSHGNLYGTTTLGGGGLCNDQTCGTVYELSPAQGSWTENIICAFSVCTTNGYWPYAGVVFDNAGNLYGTTAWGGGSVYKLSPQGNGWNSETLYYFFGFSEGWPEGGVILDSFGNLYGTTAGGSGAAGSVFKLSSNGGGVPTILHSFGSFGGSTPPGPSANLVMDSAGNLYGTTYLDGAHSQGSVFKLSSSNGLWTLTTLHDFTGGADGGQPWGQLTLDASGNIFGTTTIGGSAGFGVVFEITP
jgi:uncharacterized repeat protein (TIGR03803 family)